MADIDSRVAPSELDFGKDAARAEIALNATWQLSAMLSVLTDMADSRVDIDSYLMQAMGARMIELNSVALAAVSDPSEGIDSLNLSLYGRAVPAQ